MSQTTVYDGYLVFPAGIPGWYFPDILSEADGVLSLLVSFYDDNTHLGEADRCRDTWSVAMVSA